MADPTDINTPRNSDFARLGADEIRTIKQYINGLVVGTLGQGPTKRQCVQYGAVNSSGDPAFMTTGSGLTPDLVATATPLVLSYAAGEGSSGPINFGEVLSADAAGFVACSASNLNYISKLYTGAWEKTLAPPQYGKTYDKTAQSVLQFGGAAGSTTFLDDFGNTWAATNNGRVQTNQIKFGSGALGGGAAANTLNGTTDGVRCTQFTSLSKFAGGWALRAWVYPTTLPGAGTNDVFGDFCNAAGFGARIMINNTAGTLRWAYDLSSNGTAFDIAATTLGTSAPVINTWYFVELTYDSVAGVYRLYVNGTQEASTASAAKVCAITSGTWGTNLAGSIGLMGYLDKPEFLPYCEHPAGTAYAVPVAAPDIAVAGYASDYFDTQQMKMFKVTGVSTVAGNNPVMTQVTKLYVGECTTSGVAVTSAINYAYKATYSYQGAPVPLALTATLNVSHNIGVPHVKSHPYIVCLTAEHNFVPGDRIPLIHVPNNTAVIVTETFTSKLTASAYQFSAAPNIYPKAGALAALTTGRWGLAMDVVRDW